jgi:hypothetical protein
MISNNVIFSFQVEAAREHFTDNGLDIPWIKTPHTNQCFYKPKSGKSCSEDITKLYEGTEDGLRI